MKRFVVDCSVVMAWCFEDEADRYSDSILDMLVDVQAMVPSIWPLEVANVLLVAERKGRLTEADSSQFVALLDDLPVIIDGETSDRALSEVLFNGRQQGLSSYDAAYLELAMRQGLALATKDGKLIAAAKRCGVRLIE